MRKLIFFLCLISLCFSLNAQTTSKKKSKKKAAASTAKTAPAETKTTSTKSAESKTTSAAAKTTATKPAETKTAATEKAESKAETTAKTAAKPAAKKDEPALLIKKGSKLVVLVQSIENLEKGEENWLPGAVRDRLEDDLSTYTEYIFVDAKNLSSVKKLQKDSEGVAFDENDAIEIGKLTVAKHAVFITIRKTDAGYLVVSDITDLTTGEKIATAVSANYETTDGLFSVPGCAADDLTVKLCQKLGIKLTKERKYMLMHGDNILTAEEELKITKTEEKLYKSSIERLEKEIERLSKSTDLKATANKAKLEADKAMAEEKLKAAQDKKKRLAEEAKKAKEDAEEDEARSEEQKQKRDQMAKEAADKAAEVRQKVLDSESIFTKITVIENKKKALLDIQKSVDDRRNEIFEEAKAEFPKKVKAIRTKKYRAAEKDEDGNPSATALARREKQVKDLQLEIKASVDAQWDDVRALTMDSMTELYNEIKEDEDALEYRKTVTSLEDDLKIQIKTYNGKTNAWNVTFWLYSNGLPVTNQSIDLTYKNLTGKEIDISNDDAYDEFTDTVDLYNSLFSRGDPVLTFTVSYSVHSESDHTSSYKITLDDVAVTDTISEVQLCKLPFPEPVITYQMNPVYNLTGDMILRIPSKPEWDRKEAEYLGQVYSEGEENTIEMLEIPGKDILMAKTETTQMLYKEIMGKNPSNWNSGLLPVEKVSWVDAVTFCNKLSEKMGLTPVYNLDGNDTTWNNKANGYRLPTVSEFEYASKGGQNFKYAGSDNAGDVAWYDRNSENKTHLVGLKKPNGYGLYDMTGNVWEWCWDKGNYYSSYRAYRGGSYGSYSSYSEIGYSNSDDYYDSGSNVGFRVCRNKTDAFYKRDPIPENDNTEDFWAKYEKLLSLKDVKMNKIPGKKYVMAETEVTQELYDIIMNSNPSSYKGDKLPVENVTALNVAEFCNKLSEFNGYEKAYVIDSGNITWNYGANGYRVPTKEEWEFAARGNEDFDFAGSSDADEVAWLRGNSDYKTHEVKTKKANKFGLYDMSGNVSEFIWTGKIIAACGGNYDGYTRLHSEDLFTNASSKCGFRLCRGTVSEKEVSVRNGDYAWRIYDITKGDAKLRIKFPYFANSSVNYRIENNVLGPAEDRFYERYSEWEKGLWITTVEQVTFSKDYICLLVSTIDPERTGPDKKVYKTEVISKDGYTKYRSDVTNLYNSDLTSLCEPVYKKFEKAYKKANGNADAGGYSILDYYTVEDNILTQWIELGATLPETSRKIVKVKINFETKKLISSE